MAQSFDKQEGKDSVDFRCESESCGRYATYYNCSQCSRNIPLAGRHAYKDRIDK